MIAIFTTLCVDNFAIVRYDLGLIIGILYFHCAGWNYTLLMGVEFRSIRI